MSSRPNIIEVSEVKTPSITSEKIIYNLKHHIYQKNNLQDQIPYNENI